MLPSKKSGVTALTNTQTPAPNLTAPVPSATLSSKQAYLPTYQAKMTQRYLEQATPTAVNWTPTPTSPSADLFHNVEVAPEMAWGQADGSLLLLDYSTSDDILLDLTTGAKTPIDPIEPLDYCAYVSPNRSRIACYAGTGASAKLVILDHQGKIIKTYPWKGSWYFLDGWLNDDQVMLTADSPVGYDPYQNFPTTLFSLEEDKKPFYCPISPRSII